MRRLATLAAVATLGLGLTACGGSDDGGNEELKNQLVEELGLSSGDADCVINELGDKADMMLDLLDPESDFVPSEDELVALDRVGDECGLE
ncbi:MAG: hypothetical protein GY929_00840 [Actinomycetia bacterium]|nr:hypothetical protein [Actinomycetes bacterium]